MVYWFWRVQQRRSGRKSAANRADIIVIAFRTANYQSYTQWTDMNNINHVSLRRGVDCDTRIRTL